MVYDIIDLCLQQNADPNIYDEHFYTPLSLVIEIFNSIPLVELLFKYGANKIETINRKTNNGFTCLYDYVEHQNKEIIELLILNGLDLNKKLFEILFNTALKKK